MSSLMAQYHRILPLNPHGRDLVVGDIHGAYEKLRMQLLGIGFKSHVDRLLSVGDLIDRNPDSYQALNWLEQSYFWAVRGNHENMYLNWRYQGDEEYAKEYLNDINGGSWVQSHPEHFHQSLTESIEELPYLMSVPFLVQGETKWALLVHADFPSSWLIDNEPQVLSRDWLCQPQHELLFEDPDFIDFITWNRKRLLEGRKPGVDLSQAMFDNIEGYDLVIVGHSTVNTPLRMGHFIYWDAGGWIDQRSFPIKTLQDLYQHFHQLPEAHLPKESKLQRWKQFFLKS